MWKYVFVSYYINTVSIKLLLDMFTFLVSPGRAPHASVYKANSKNYNCLVKVTHILLLKGHVKLISQNLQGLTGQTEKWAQKCGVSWLTFACLSFLTCNTTTGHPPPAYVPATGMRTRWDVVCGHPGKAQSRVPVLRISHHREDWKRQLVPVQLRWADPGCGLPAPVAV